MRFRATAVAVVSAALFAPPAVIDAGAAQSYITITGSRTAYAWLVVKRTANYDLDRASAEYGGRWAGVAIARDGATMWSTYATLWDDPILFGVSDTRGVLRPGRYKVRLFTDAQDATVKIPWTGPNVALRPSGRVDATIQAKQVVVDGTKRAVGMSFPQDGRVGSNTNLVIHHRAVAGPSVMVEACFTRHAETCEGAVDRVTQPVTATALNVYGLAWGLYNWDRATKGLYARGQLTGTTVGLLTVFSLRFNP